MTSLEIQLHISLARHFFEMAGLELSAEEEEEITRDLQLQNRSKYEPSI